MKAKTTSIVVTCNNPNCNFTGRYHNTTRESVIATRNFMSKIQAVGNECLHTDYEITEVEN